MNNELTVTTDELAYCINLTKQRVHQLVEKKILSKDMRDSFNLTHSIRSYCDYMRGVSRGSEMSQAEKKERLRILRSKANLSEIEAAEKMGLVVRIDAIRAADIKIAITLRTNLMSIADRIAPILAASSDESECYHLINNEVRNSLESAVSAMKKLTIDDSLLDLTNLNISKKIEENNLTKQPTTTGK